MGWVANALKSWKWVAVRKRLKTPGIDTLENLNVGEFTYYMDRTSINGTFKPETWNVFDSNEPRTDNHLEEWHNSLNSFLVRGHPNIYIYINLWNLLQMNKLSLILSYLTTICAFAPPNEKVYISLECRNQSLPQKYLCGE